MKNFISYANASMKIIILVLLSCFLNIAYALPFNIVPKQNEPLPTSLMAGKFVNAYYTVTNNTASTRSGNHVKYLPPNVEQTTNNGTYADTCSISFTLISGGSCTLQLKISGAVNAKDPDPHHHLFVCFPGDKVCAGTNNPLNVSIIPAVPDYIVTPVAGPNGSISPSSAQTVSFGHNISFQATPSTNYTVKLWLLDGEIVQFGGSSYTLTNVTTNHKVQVTFSEIHPWITNGTVNALLYDPTNLKIYLGGNFTTVSMRTGIGAPLDQKGSLLADFPPIVGTELDAIIDDGHGGWYIGGSFTFVGGVARANIAHIKNDYTVDTAFNPGAGFDGKVKSLALGKDGKLYCAGDFTKFNQINRNLIACLNTDGSLNNSFNPVGPEFGATINGLAISPTGLIYCVGSFVTFNGISTGRIARLKTDGTLDNTFMTGSGFSFEVMAITVTPEGKIYCGGQFGQYNGISRLGIARLNADGSLDMNFDPAVGFAGGGEVLALALNDDGKLYCGGNFLTYRGISQRGILRLNTDASLDTSFNSGNGFDNRVYTLAVGNNGTLYCGGDFTQYNLITGQNHIVRLLPSGALDTSFNSGTGFNTHVLAIAFNKYGNIYCGGSFLRFNEIGRRGIARMNANGTLDTSFNPGTGFSPSSFSVNALALTSNNLLYCGGIFTSFNGTNTNRIARLKMDGSLDTSFQPGTAFNNTVNALLIDTNNLLYCGGSFTSFNGTTINRVARLKMDGTLDSGFTPPGTSFSSGAVNALALTNDNKLYCGGTFATSPSSSRNLIVRLDNQGNVDTAFAPSGVFNAPINALALADDGGIYCGGFFTNFNGTSRKYLARLNPDGTLNGFNSPGSGFNGPIKTLALSDDSKLYAGGFFANYNGSLPSFINRIDLFGALDTTFQPIVSSIVNVISPYGNKVYVGGNFGLVNNLPSTSFAIINK